MDTATADAPSTRSGGTGAAARGRPEMRPHDADGLSPEAHAVISEHSLDKRAVLGWADHYAMRDGVDFNRAPARDFGGAPLGMELGRMVVSQAAFVPFALRFNAALESFDYSTSDAIISSCLRDGVIADPVGAPVYSRWRPYAERLEGFNVALYRAALSARTLLRAIGGLGEIDSYLAGRWRRKGDPQNRVPMTVGESNSFLNKRVVATVAYSTVALRGWMQPVRYSPYPRNTNSLLEQFGAEKDGFYAGEGEVHVHAGCPIPAPEHIKITLSDKYRRWRSDVHERYSRAGLVE